jgi:DNA replication protein DnaC
MNNPLFLANPFGNTPRFITFLGHFIPVDSSQNKEVINTALVKTDLLVLDDWGIAPFTDEQRRDLLEILEDRHGRRSSLVTAQLPVDKWHAQIGDPTLADAILDRLIHKAHKIPLKGDSMRKLKSSLT